ncbi:hypothetical protein CRYUN_Cryun07bG0197100 [Craigia yunnanensis]
MCNFDNGAHLMHIVNKNIHLVASSSSLLLPPSVLSPSPHVLLQKLRDPSRVISSWIESCASYLRIMPLDSELHH